MVEYHDHILRWPHTITKQRAAWIKFAMFALCAIRWHLLGYLSLAYAKQCWMDDCNVIYL